MKDSIRQGVLAGLLGSVGDAHVHWSAYFLVGTSTTAHYIAQLVYPLKEPTFARLLTGFVIHFAAGSLVAVLLALIFKYYGKDSPYYKGVGMATTLWIVHVAVIPNIVSPRPFLFRTELEVLIDLISHLAYGIIATIYLIRTLKDEIIISA